jgi:acyl-CoA thioesterase-1
MVGPPPVRDRETSARAADLAAGMAQVCASRAVPFVDVTAGLSADPIWRRQEVAAGDSVRPSTRGYAQLATLVAPPTLQWLIELITLRNEIRL